MMGKSRVFTVAVALVLALAFSSTVYGAEQKVITWKLAGVWGPGDPAYLPETLAKMITERSSGRIKVVTYPSGQLYGQKELFSALQKGLIELCDIPTGWWGDTIPVFKFPDMPFMVRNNKEWKVWLDAGMLQIAQRESEKVGIKNLSLYGWQSLACFSIHPVETLEDVKGKKWRVYTPQLGAAARNLGASPVTIGIPEVYQAFERGVIDAGFMGVTWAYSYKWPEVTKYITKVDLANPAEGFFVNKNAFDSLPPDLQQVVIKAGQDIQKMSWGVIDGFVQKAWDAINQSGKNVVYTLPEAERNKWITQAKSKQIWMDEVKKIGPLGQKVMDSYFKAFPDRKP